MSFFKKIKEFIIKIRDPKDPTTKLSAISFLMILLSTVVLSLFISYFLSYQLQSHNAQSVVEFVKSYVAENFDAKELDFSVIKSAQLSGETGKKLMKLKRVLNAKRINIINPTGKIRWSDNERIIGLTAEEERVKKALKDKLVYGFAEKDEKNTDFVRRESRIFEVFVPISFDDGVTAIIEAYKSPATISKSIYLAWLFVWVFTIGGGMILYAVFARAILRSSQQTKILQYELIEYSEELETNIQLVTEVQNIAILGLSKLAEYRDKETGQHLERMSLYSKLLAEELSGWDEYKFRITKDYVDSLYTSAVLHDIGKVGIPDRVLQKPGALNEDEWVTMKKHTVIGGDALAAADKQLGIESFLTIGKEVAYYHHERFNGKGYPFGKKGEDIPLSARIVALADVFDAVTSKRVYKPAIKYDEAKSIVLKMMNDGHFDPNIVNAFLNIEDKFKHVLETMGGE